MQYQLTLFYPNLKKELREFAEKIKKVKEEYPDIQEEDFYYLSLFHIPLNFIYKNPKEALEHAKNLVNLEDVISPEDKTTKDFLEKDLLRGEEVFEKIERGARRYHSLLGAVRRLEKSKLKRGKLEELMNSEERFKRLLEVHVGKAIVVIRKRIGKYKKIIDTIKETWERAEGIDISSIREICENVKKLSKLIDLAFPFFHKDISRKKFYGFLSDEQPLLLINIHHYTRDREERFVDAATYKLDEFLKGNPVEESKELNRRIKYLEFRTSALSKEISEIMANKWFKSFFQRNLGKENYTPERVIRWAEKLGKTTHLERDVLEMLRRLRSAYRARIKLEKRKEKLVERLESMLAPPARILVKVSSEDEHYEPYNEPPRKGTIGDYMLWLLGFERHLKEKAEKESGAAGIRTQANGSLQTHRSSS